MKKIYTALTLLTFTMIFIADLIAVKIPVFGRVGVFFWFLSYVLIFVFVIYCLFFIIKRTIRFKSPFVLIALSLLILYIVINASIVKPNGDATQEIGCALDKLSQSIDSGYRQTCSLGYPARQYYLPGALSLLFGRSAIALNLGSCLYLFLGLVMFAASIMNFFPDKKIADLISAVFLALILHIYHFHYALFLFDQAIYPFSFALMLCGLYLFYLKKRSIYLIFLIGIVNFYLVYSYTPSLALLALVIFIQILMLFNNKTTKNQKIIFILSGIAIIFSLWLSLGFRDDLRLIGTDNAYGNINGIKNLSVQVFKHLLLSTEGIPIFTSILGTLVIIVLTFSLLLAFGKAFFLISFWAAATFFISIYSQGYIRLPIDESFHRAIIVVPVIFTMVVVILKPVEYLLKKNMKLIVILLIVIEIIGYLYAKEYVDKTRFADLERGRRSILLDLIMNKMPKEKLKKEGNLLLDHQLQSDYRFIAIADQSMYYLPKKHIVLLNESCTASTTSNIESGDIVLMDSDSKCLNYYSSKYIATFSYFKEKPVLIYEIK
ncbi:hypothetical protein A3C23_04450 [Candidatus Roizmanbacteria bacterium RIFCSPHIGHO2_02_FULL_37_13b]|uniref:Glycosyltransferase RgtA/B/C/D-like domain-containing protein n=1 Tax=Candidatus Roizmanbacteria bacterium RIFCSPLOWO2_02_FULL_36_11 TaxID=1802071 RepID=A0A1F7JH71_9BACT|nr:MAG: hypothetical protein A3C23_04450 [Candidatus Roizmanbacteria bacterium RIFCSPHIGHO2_02_FULL_37_13b]OGK54958.1 MAG: hypothetical protein A3H78_00595 [Candidatus Roizmanbacteria bacterium RIFCSPLOWO2_02_FULL_36_11]